MPTSTQAKKTVYVTNNADEEMSWIKTICEGVSKAFNTIRKPLQYIPTLMLLCEVKQRPGLSAIALTTAVIQRLSEAGIDTGTNPDGSPNKIGQFVRIFSEEIVREFQDNASVNLAVDAGSVTTQATGANAGGPVTVFGTNVLPTQAQGIIR